MAKIGALGKVNSNFDYNAGGHSAGTTGAQMTMTPQRGLGAKMVNNLDGVVANYKRTVADDRRAEAQQRAAQKRAEREANSYASLDALLDDILG